MAPVPRDDGVPVSGDVMSVIITLVSISVLSTFLFERISVIKNWRRLPFVAWIVFAIYIDSYTFVFATAILQHSFGVNLNAGMCQGAILLCLVCYISTKLVYLFLVEKAYIVRNTARRRLQSKLYIFNFFGMLSIFFAIAVLNFVYRIARYENGRCIIGMESKSMIPLISFDTAVNVYLTCLFLVSLRKLYSFKHMTRSSSNLRLRNIAFRTFIGAACMLVSSVVNLTVLMVLNGEPGWVCLICCNCDILFSAIVIHWVTSKDNAASLTPNSSRTGNEGRSNPHTSTYIEPPQMTPRGAPSYLSGNTDEVSLITRSTHSSDERNDSIAKIQIPGGVYVTTTIQRQSIPSGLIVDTGKTETDNSDSYDRPPPRRASFGNGRQDTIRSPRTRISGGIQPPPSPSP